MLHVCGDADLNCKGIILVIQDIILVILNNFIIEYLLYYIFYDPFNTLFLLIKKVYCKTVYCVILAASLNIFGLLSLTHHK